MRRNDLPGSVDDVETINVDIAPLVAADPAALTKNDGTSFRTRHQTGMLIGHMSLLLVQ